MAIFIDRVALAKQRDSRIGSICPSVRPSINALTSVSSFPRSKVVGQCQDQIFWRVADDTRGSALPSAAKANNHPRVWNKYEKNREESLYISPRCLSVCRLSCADAVDRLLIPYGFIPNCHWGHLLQYISPAPLSVPVGSRGGHRLIFVRGYADAVTKMY